MKLLSLFSAILLISASNTAHAASCPIGVNEVVSFATVESTFASLPKPIVKDEFETTAEYEQRKAQMTTSSNPIIVETTKDFDPDYDADYERFEVSLNSFFSSFYKTRDYDYDGNGVTLTDSDRTFFMAIDKRIMGSSVGTNAFGAEAVITKEHWKRDYVYDRAKGSYTEPRRVLVHDYMKQKEVRWQSDLLDVPYISIPSPRHEARGLKGLMRTAIVLSPKSPFQFSGTHTSRPTIDNPKQQRVDDRFLVADVHCVLIADNSGKVLKVVETTY